MELHVENIYSGYANKEILKEISFTLQSGEILCVLGANGSGKTTLFKALLRLIPLFRGCVSIDGKDAAHMPNRTFSRLISYIPQQHTPVFSYTVEEMAMMGRASHIDLFSTPSSHDYDFALDILEKLHILHLKDAYYTQISGGERRLTLIARALCQEAKILVMDEPSADLDYANQQLITQTILTLKRQGYSVILSTHAPQLPYAVADKMLLLKKGKMIAYGAPETELTEEALSRAFDVNMNIFEFTDKNGAHQKVCLPG